MNQRASKLSTSRLAAAQQLFEQFYAQCFWHMPSELRVKPGDIPAIVKGLRTFGGHRGFVAASSLCLSATSKQPSSRR